MRVCARTSDEDLVGHVSRARRRVIGSYTTHSLPLIKTKKKGRRTFFVILGLEKVMGPTRLIPNEIQPRAQPGPAGPQNGPKRPSTAKKTLFWAYLELREELEGVQTRFF